MRGSFLRLIATAAFAAAVCATSPALVTRVIAACRPHIVDVPPPLAGDEIKVKDGEYPLGGYSFELGRMSLYARIARADWAGVVAEFAGQRFTLRPGRPPQLPREVDECMRTNRLADGMLNRMLNVVEPPVEARASGCRRIMVVVWCVGEGSHATCYATHYCTDASGGNARELGTVTFCSNGSCPKNTRSTTY